MNMHYSPLDPAAAEALTAPPRPWWRRVSRTGWALVAIGLLVAGWLAWRLLAPAPTPVPAGGPAQPAPSVTVVVPGTSTVSSVVRATGSIAARRDMPVGVAGEGGQVSAVRAEAGQRVGAGQVLAEIDSSVQRAQLSQLESAVGQARADARLAQAELDRAQALVARGFISRADIDRRTAARDSASARVRVADAQVRESRERLARLAIRSPAAGVVLQRSVEAGQVVGAGSGSLFRVAMNGDLELRAAVAEQDLARLRVGMPADVTPVGSTTVYRGRIWLIDPIIDPQSRQGTARVALSFAPGIRVGGFASADIRAGETQAPLLPQSAVLADNAGSYVMVVGDDNRVKRINVRVATVNGQGVAIAAGLTGRERVVQSAGAFLKPGEKIAPVVAPRTTARS